MAQEFKVIKVSEQEPREWTGDYGTTYYIKVQVEGHGKPIEVGKKTKDGVHVGDVLYGTIRETNFPTDSFKAEKPAFGGNFGGGPKPQRDDSHIRAQWAIGQAMTHFAHKEEVGLDKVEKLAGALFQMVDRVKTVAQPVASPEADKGQFEEDMKFVKELGEAVHDEIKDKPVELSEVPF